MKSFYEHHGFDEADAYDMSRDDVNLELQCNRCGSHDVRWRQQSGRWVLFSLTPGVMHACPVNTDGFSVVPE